MIINTGCRTDIPAYYSEWFYNRIKEGFVLARNPYYPNQVMKYQLHPEVVDCLAFCTKNPEPMLDRLEELKKFHQFWFVTITPYGRDMEPNVPAAEEVAVSFRRLSQVVGLNCIGWRYDPIIITEKYTLEYHAEAFEKLAAELSGYVDYCVISFVDLYEKTKRNFPGVRVVSLQEQRILAEHFVDVGKKYGIRIRSCCEGTELAKYGVDVSGCMTREVWERAIGSTLDIPAQQTAKRGNECSCILGNDIGMYNTCGHGCLYCYANYNMDTVRKNMMQHDPESPLLIGKLRPEDIVKEAKQKSYIDGQLSLFSSCT